MHLSFLFCSSGEAAATQGTGEAGLGGSPVSSGKTTPQQPYGPPALLQSSKGICFHSAECTEYKQAKSHTPPLPQHPLPQPVTNPPVLGALQGPPLVSPLPLEWGCNSWCISSHCFPFLSSSCPPWWAQPLSIEDPALQSRLRGWRGQLLAWAALGHLLAPCPSFPICQALGNTVKGPEMGKE